MGLITLILQSLASLLKWLALKEEVKLKRMVIDLKDEINGKEQSVKEQVRELNDAGRVNDADRVLNDFLGQSQFLEALQRRISELQKGSENPNS